MAWHVPVGGDVSGEGETSADDTFNATSLDTLFFSPTKEDYVQAVKSAQLQEYLKPAEYPSVYIITGMKIAREPSIALKRGKKIAAQGMFREASISLHCFRSATASVKRFHKAFLQLGVVLLKDISNQN